ncbi:MAG: hypothetical protein LBH56_02880, partial [Coriobacteriales bacterium]|nr:hypothetical protein [Coriobacteriales bacterium]
MGTIKKVAKLLVVGAVLGMTLMLVACGSSNAGRGISASHPETAMDEAFSRYLNGEDYMQIFAADVEKSQV